MSRLIAGLSALVGGGLLLLVYISENLGDTDRAILYAIVALNFMVLSMGMGIVGELEERKE